MAARRRAGQLLREERPRRYAVLGAAPRGSRRPGRGATSRHGDHLEFPIVDDLATLTWLANLAALELHVHQWTVGRNGQPRNPDRLVIDLDPGEGAGLHECAAVALLVRDALAERDLDSWPVTSGSKGLHLYAALPGKLNPEGTTGLAKAVAEELQAEHPTQVTATMTKARRSGKVFLDWSQNAGSKTTLSPYSLRGREQAVGRDAARRGTRSRRAPRTRWRSSSCASSRCCERVADRGRPAARLAR